MDLNRYPMFIYITTLKCRQLTVLHKFVTGNWSLLRVTTSWFVEQLKEEQSSSHVVITHLYCEISKPHIYRELLIVLR